MKSLFCVLIWGTTWLASAEAAAAAHDTSRPNIVVILVDDMGFSDIGCYGSEIPTPNLDQLASNGLRFTQFYNTGRCCPTRATLLTGLYAHQTGVGHMNADLGRASYQGFLNQQCVTLGDVASSAGYFTAMTGKWHVGARSKAMYPTARGFDRFYGVPEGGGFYFQPKPGRTVVLDEQVVGSVDKPLPADWYSTDAWTEYGLKFVDDAIQADKPFLLHVAHNAPHFPLQAPAEDISRHRGEYTEGWDVLAERRWEKQLQLGLMNSQWIPAGRADGVAAWDDVSAPDRDRFDHMMAVYAACVEHMDRSVGALVDGLQERGQLDNTLILFMSDNGGCAESGVRGKSDGDPTTADSNWFCGKSWAWMQDTPFRKFKHYNHEGGISTPLIAHWPQGISDRGSFRHTPTHLIDVMATVTDLSQAVWPKEHKGHAILPPEGTSLQPLFAADVPLPRDALYWEHEGNAAVRKGDWKLVREGAKGAWELYNLVTDRTEQHDLADTQPARVAELTTLWMAWARRCDVATNGLPRKGNGPKKKNRKRKQANADVRL